MEWSSDRVLDFEPRTHQPIGGVPRVDLLWPVRAWRVLFSKRDRQPLDPFQLLVLRMAQAGEVRFEEIARLAALDPMLVAYTGASLQERGLLDFTGVITEEGSTALEEDAAVREQVELGWVFEEAFTGEYFPIFALELSTAECEVGDDKKPIVVIGTKGKPRRLKPFVLSGNDSPPTPPEPRLIEKAIERHERMLTRHNRAGRMVGLKLELPPRAVRLADSEPFEGHLRTILYMTPDDDIAPWFVADPFGFGGSEFLRRILDDRQNRGDLSALALLRRLSPRDSNLAEHGMAETQLYEHEASDRIGQRLPLVGMRGEEAVRDALKRAFRESIRLDYSRTSRDKETVPAPEAASTLLSIRQGIEEGLELLRNECPLGDAWRHLAIMPTGKKGAPTDRTNSQRKETIRAHATQLGFAERAIPPAMLSAKFGKVLSLAQEGSSANIRPLLAALCLSAPDYPSHPLKLIANENPGWLAEIDELASMAGDAVHTSRKIYSLDTISAAIERCCDLLLSLLKSLAIYRKG